MFKIGDFSKLTRVSVRMLRHYDEIGLLKPQLIDNFTGYRFYSADQILRLNRIFVLKEMGFSLSEISGIIERNWDPKLLLILLQKRKCEISQAIEKENEKLLRVETIIKLINKEDSIMKYEVALKSIPSYKVASLRDIIPSYHAEGKLWEELQVFAEMNSLKCSSASYAIYHDQGYKESDVDVEVTLCVKEAVAETERIKFRELEAVQEMAVVMHLGPFEELSSAYHALGVWMESNGYEMDGPTRAIYHKGPWCEPNPENYLTEVQAPVTKKNRLDK